MAPQQREKAELCDLTLAGNYFAVFGPVKAQPSNFLGIRGWGERGDDPLQASAARLKQCIRPIMAVFPLAVDQQRLCSSDMYFLA